MSSPIDILTDTSQALALASAQGYSANVLAHVYNDFAGHNSLRIFEGTRFRELVVNHRVTTSSCRILLTDQTGTQRILKMPVILTSGSTTIGGPPVILQNPLSQTLAAGVFAQFSVVVASPTTPSYQWSKNAVNLSGATGPTLLLTNISSSDSGTYATLISNSFGSVASTPAILVVTTTEGGGSANLPIITYQSPNPATNVNVVAGSTSTLFLYIDTSSASAVSFQWQRNSTTLLPTAQTAPQTWLGHPTGSILAINLANLPFDSSMAGFYRVISTNDNGNTVSAEWTVTLV